MTARAWPVAGALMCGLVTLAASPTFASGPFAGSNVERPYDAPAPTTHQAPDLTPEYTSIEEQGIRLVYHLRSRDKAHALMSRALACRAELAAMLGHDVLGTVEIRVAASLAQMPALAPPELPAGVNAAAFTVSASGDAAGSRASRLVVMNLGSPMPDEVADLQQHLRHELAHLALDEAAPGADLPRWFHEGFAIHVASDDAAGRAQTLTGAALRERLMGMRDVELRFPAGQPSESVAAAEAAELVRFLGEPRPHFRSLVQKLGQGDSFDRALAGAYDSDLEQLDRGFRKDLARRYSFVPVLGVATMAWVVVALSIALRRRRHAEQQADAAEERRALGAAARLLASDPGRHLPIENDELAQAIPPDPEVPKIEHDGRWHTLH